MGLFFTPSPSAETLAIEVVRLGIHIEDVSFELVANCNQLKSMQNFFHFTSNAKLMSPAARLRPKVWLVSASRVVYSLAAMPVSRGTAMPSMKPSTEAATSQ